MEKNEPEGFHETKETKLPFQSKFLIFAFDFVIIPIIIFIFIEASMIIYEIRNKVVIPTSEKIDTFLTLFSILIAIVAFKGGIILKKDNHLKNQKDLLRSLLIRLEYLAGEDVMRIFGEPMRISHLKWYLTAEGIPTHKVLEIDPDFFASKLDHEIMNEPTHELKKSLYYVKDKVNMINYWNEKRLEIALEPNISENSKNDKEIRIKKCTIFVKEALDDLEKFIPKIKSHIQTKFRISLSN